TNVRFDVGPVASEQETLVFQGLFFRTPPNTARFSMEVFDASGFSGVTPADNNVDIFMRADGPFDNIQNSDGTLAYDRVIAQSDYYAASLINDDKMDVAEYHGNAIAGREWHLLIVAGQGSGGAVGLRALITPTGTPEAAAPIPANVEVDFFNTSANPECDIGPWADNTPFTPTAGNDATTLGDARINAMLAAAQEIASDFASPRPIKVAACWRNDGGDAQAAAVALGRPFRLSLDFPNAPARGVLYAQSVVERFSGTDLCGLPIADCSTGICSLAQLISDCNQPDIEVFFNTDVDGSVALGDNGFYYGIDPGARAPGDVDFVAVATHELVHGFGFTTGLRGDGSVATSPEGREINDAFLAQLVDGRVSPPRPVITLSQAERASLARSESGLKWRGPESTLNVQNPLANVGDGFIDMHAPPEFQPRSSVTHFNLFYCELMIPSNRENCDPGFRDIGLSKAMLREVGWYDAPVEPYRGLMFDPSRDGHGYEIQLAGFDGDGRALYILTYYTYNTETGAPEWYQAVGIVENGVFYGSRNPAFSLDGINGLYEVDYDATRSPPQQAVPGHRGDVVLVYNDSSDGTACNDSFDRPSAEVLVPMQWRIDDQVDEWCMQQLIPAALEPANDFGGLWWAGFDDNGWGMSIQNFGSDLLILLYVYRDDGSAVWYLAQASQGDQSFAPGQTLTLDLIQRDGYSRLTQPTGTLSDRTVGTITITLADPSSDFGAGNSVSIDARFVGAAGDDTVGWQRTDVPIALLTLPR
ncbi:MAG: hypothetical protein AAGE01_13355, partial [Pseudomonadota bacterium]